MIAVMSVSEQLPYVLISYVVTVGGIGLYVWRVLRQARGASTQVPPEDRPWT
ncbi:MAG: hypothetical protein ACKPDI_00625 [Actinomycetota bacterium]